ncbi:MAG: glycoside hydrolase family 65 protein [Firmicutes bacterium]|nr:glycoside hydrolase family 65 protein [Bacillota bacterium]
MKNEKLKILPWSLEIKDMDAEDYPFYESILAQGNGYMGVRGFDPAGIKRNSFERSVFLAGFFEYIKPGITDMVNMPDLFAVRFGVSCHEISANATLDLRTGLLTRSSIWQLASGEEFSLVSRRIISMQNKHATALEVEIKPLDGNLTIVLETGLDGDVTNLPVSDDQMTENTECLRLLNPALCEANQSGGTLIMESTYSKRRVYQAYRVWANLPLCATGLAIRDYTAVRLEGVIPAGESLILSKTIATYSYRDDVDDPLSATIQLADQLAELGFAGILEESSQAWDKLWTTCDIELDGDPKLQGAIRYNIFQLLQNNAADDPYVSIGARGLMHGRYKGNYFWDTEIFMLPFFLYTRPEAAKNLLLYRYHMLPSARKVASSLGLKGARYPWMSSDTGTEQCETWDTGCCEVHITADVAYAVQEYVRISGDQDFLIHHGAEMLVETARYWVSRLTYDDQRDCYNMLFVKGPDEYCGVTTNNTYTNYLVRENLLGAIRAIDFVRQQPQEWSVLQAKLQVTDQELETFAEVAQKIAILYDPEREILLQDELFERLQPLDISTHKRGAAALYRTIPYDRLQRYKVIKQADLVLLMVLYPERFTSELKQNIWSYYEPLTLHDSSLSFGTHAHLAAELGYQDVAWDYFQKSVFLDLYNIMDNTDREGIHLAALGASWQALIQGMAGLRQGEDGKPQVNPKLPPAIRGLRFAVMMGGYSFKVIITQTETKIEAHNH